MIKINKYNCGIILLIMLFLLTSCGVSDGSENGDAVKSYCVQYASDYKVVEKTNEGEIAVCIICPDFEEIARIMVEEGEERITVKSLEKTVNDNSDFQKEYLFIVENLTEENIEEAFLEKVAYDLMVSAIEEVEYTERWSMEE